MSRTRPSANGSPAKRSAEAPAPVDPEEYTYTALSAAQERNFDLDIEAMSVMSHLLRVHSMIARDLEVNIHRPAGSTFAAFRMMFLLRTHGSMPPQDIAELLHVAPSSISAVVKTLERYGLVKRSRKSRDGRVVTVELTDYGMQIVDELGRRQNRRERDWVAPLSERERRTLVRLLNKLIVQHPGPPESVEGRLLGEPQPDAG